MTLRVKYMESIMKLSLSRIVIFSFIVVLITSNCVAQFGISHPQYKEFKWKYIESKHFDIYFHDDAKYLADFTAITAEKALVSIQHTLNFRITKRISIIVYNSHNEFQQTNVISMFMPEGVGGVTESLKNRVVVPFQGEYEIFEHVIHHELVHAVINEMLFGGTFQTSLYTGRNIEFPGWMNEGLAEYESFGGLDSQTDMFMRDLSLSEKLGDLQSMDDYLAYRGGQTFYWYIADKYGPQMVGDLINRIKISGSLNSAFKFSFKMDVEEFSKQWKKELKKYYWPDIERFKDPEDFAQRITDHSKDRNFYNSSPAISPDGQRVAYISDRDRIFGLYVLNLDDKKNPKELISSQRTQDFEDLNMVTPGISWSPDGKQIAVSAKSGGDDAIFIVNAKNGDYDKISLGLKSISSVNWAPDGKKLCFIATKLEKSDIFLYDIKSKKVMNITNDVFSDAHPVWGPDSKIIYFISDRVENVTTDTNSFDFKLWDYKERGSDLYSINVETKEITRLTFDPGYTKTSVAVSADGLKLLYVSDKNGIGNIYELNLKSGKILPKTNSLNGISQITLSKDGNKLLFSTLIDNGYDIFLINFPFDLKIGADTIPITKLRQNKDEKKLIIKGIEKIVSADSVPQPQKLVGFGNFELELSRQQVVKPNPDAQEQVKLEEPETVKGDISDSSFIARNYKIRFSLDLIMGNPGFSTLYGFQGMTQVLFSDVLGDHQIYVAANLLIDLRNSNFFAAYIYQPEIIDYQISAFHNAVFIYRGNRDDSLFRYRSFGASIGASYPFDLFNRLEWGINWLNATKEDVYNPSNPTASRMLFIPEARYVHDNTQWSSFYPFQGTRYTFGVKGTPKFSSSGIGFMTFQGDYRHYIPLWDYMSIGFRATGGVSLGPNPQKFYLGGVENWINRSFSNNTLPFENPEDYSLAEFIMPIRGFDVNERNGDKFFLTNIELRFPLFRALLAGPIPILFQSVLGSVFLDLGGTWSGGLSEFTSAKTNENGELVPADLLMSMGVGIRSYVLGIPFKLDIAWQNQFHTWSKPIYLFSLGYDF